MTKRIMAICLVLLAAGVCTVAQADISSRVNKAIGLEEALVSLPEALRTPNRYALIVGVGEYTDSRIPKLSACPNDARQLYDVLTDPSVGMFPTENVTLLSDKNVTRNKVVDALDTLSRKAGKEDLVVVFFSGHGAVDEKGRSYWVMHDSAIDRLRATALAETEITELLGEIRTARLVTLIDACYSASTAKLGKSKSLLDLRKIYPKFTGDGRVAITASKGDQLSVVISDKKHPGKGYSVFSWHLISAMKGLGDMDKDGVVTVNELWSYVKDRTETTARQQGGNQQPQLKGQVGSKFLLTVDSQRLIEKSQQIQQGMATLKKLVMEDKITVGRYKEAEQFIKTDPVRLSETDRQKRKVYLDLAEGRLTPRYLQAALDAIETPTQRAIRLEREAKKRAERIKQAKIKELLSVARANDNKTNGKKALRALAELLVLSPGHSEALALQRKISGYYASAGDVTTNSIGMQLVYIPAGDFMMGSGLSASQVASQYGGKADFFEDEHPQHKVRLTQGFWMGQYEVTIEQFRKFVRATGYRTLAERGIGNSYGITNEGWKKVESLNWQNPGIEQGNNHPVVQIHWEDAKAFCEWLTSKEDRTYSLPTEAQWEYACRAGTTTVFSFGDTMLSGYANIADQAANKWISQYNRNYNNAVAWNDGYGTTAPVGSYKPNPWNLYDVHGNVWEWCSDWGVSGYYQSSPSVDPAGPTSGSNRVLRGGSWSINPWDCRSANRNRRTPGNTDYLIGFRVVVSVSSLDF